MKNYMVDLTHGRGTARIQARSQNEAINMATKQHGTILSCREMKI